MKYSLLFTALFLMLFFPFCKKENRGVRFNMSIEEEFTVNSGNPINLPFSLLLPDLETNSQKHFENNNTRAEYVSEIKLSDLDLVIMSPENQDFSFLKEVEIFISSDGLEEKRLAYKKDIQSSKQSISLNTEDYDFADYIKKEYYSLRVRTVVKSTFSNSIKLKALIVFRVKASLRRS